MVAPLTFFNACWVYFKFYEELVLFLGMGIEFKDKIMLHCFREVKCQQDSLEKFDIKYIF